jgi:uncharacterized damage-inducible protein DinB
MSIAQGYIQELQMSLKFFNNTISVFEETDSGYAAQPEMFTVAGQVAHTAATVDWFVEGAFGEGWDMDFDAHLAQTNAVARLSDAKEQLEKAYANVVEVIGATSDEELCAPIADKQIMEGARRCAIVSAISDHTAHHRGALAVYARLLGKTPPMPYA